MDNEKPIASPCISVCTLDNDDVCMGCYRTMNEITEWNTYSNAERVNVIEQAKLRLKERYPGW